MTRRKTQPAPKRESATIIRFPGGSSLATTQPKKRDFEPESYLDIIGYLQTDDYTCLTTVAENAEAVFGVEPGDLLVTNRNKMPRLHDTVIVREADGSLSVTKYRYVGEREIFAVVTHTIRALREGVR